MKLTQKIRSRVVARNIGQFVSPWRKVLDIGCGTGVVAEQLRNRFRFEVTGTDIIEYVKTGLAFKQMPDDTTLPFDDGEFDLGLINDVLHHVPHHKQGKLIKESMRVCEELIIFEEKPTFVHSVCERALNYLHSREMRVIGAYRTTRGWKRLIGVEGFRCMEFPVKLPWWYPLRPVLFHVEKKRADANGCTAKKDSKALSSCYLGTRSKTESGYNNERSASVKAETSSHHARLVQTVLKRTQ